MYDYDWTDEEYRESLKNTPEPILLSQIDTKMDLRGLMTYAKEKGKKVIEVPKEKVEYHQIIDRLNDLVENNEELS